jgi:hypothetical protein
VQESGLAPRHFLPVDNEILQAMVADNFYQSQGSSVPREAQSAGQQIEDAMAWLQTVSAETNRLWANYFTSGNASYLQTSIPRTNFFILQLLNPANFDWIRNLLKAGLSLTLNCPEFGEIEFKIPPTRPDHSFNCLADSGKEKEISPKKRASKRTTPVVLELEVRRSPRIKNSNNGFKHNSCVQKVCYLPCCVKAPTLKKEAIRSIATKIYGLDESDVTDDRLQAKRQKKYPMARARITIQEGEGSQAGKEQDMDVEPVQQATEPSGDVNEN